VIARFPPDVPDEQTVVKVVDEGAVLELEVERARFKIDLASPESHNLTFRPVSRLFSMPGGFGVAMQAMLHQTAFAISLMRHIRMKMRASELALENIEKGNITFEQATELRFGQGGASRYLGLVSSPPPPLGEQFKHNAQKRTWAACFILAGMISSALNLTGKIDGESESIPSDIRTAARLSDASWDTYKGADFEFGATKQLVEEYVKHHGFKHTKPLRCFDMFLRDLGLQQLETKFDMQSDMYLLRVSTLDRTLFIAKHAPNNDQSAAGVWDPEEFPEDGSVSGFFELEGGGGAGADTKSTFGIYGRVKSVLRMWDSGGIERKAINRDHVSLPGSNEGAFKRTFFPMFSVDFPRTQLLATSDTSRPSEPVTHRKSQGFVDTVLNYARFSRAGGGNDPHSCTSGNHSFQPQFEMLD
jgi:hypothetical protein